MVTAGAVVVTKGWLRSGLRLVSAARRGGDPAGHWGGLRSAMRNPGGGTGGKSLPAAVRMGIHMGDPTGSRGSFSTAAAIVLSVTSP